MQPNLRRDCFINGINLYAYDLNNNYKRITVWPDIGGTMTMVPIPGTLNFVATQRFYPGFNSSQCRIVKEIFNGTNWDQTVVGDFPYIHRFDLISHDGGLWFVGCSIANSKKNTDDWSDPGRIWVGDYDDREAKVNNLKQLDFELTKNHGYKRMDGYSLITGAQGIYRLDYPDSNGDWKLTRLVDRETSDIASADLNDNGKPEYLAIEGFHGPYIRIYDCNFNTIFKSGSDSPFGHAIWGGLIGSKQYFIFGFRSERQNLELIGFEDGKPKFNLIESNVGPSNVLVYGKEGVQYLLSANREANQVAIYKILNTD